MASSSSYRRGLLFLILLLGFSSCADGKAELIDLNQEALFIRKGFSVEWTRVCPERAPESVAGFSAPVSSWIKIEPARDRTAAIHDIFPDEDFATQEPPEFSIVVCFNASNRPLSEPAGIFLPGIGQNWQVFLNGVLQRSEWTHTSGKSGFRDRSMIKTAVAVSTELQPKNVLFLRVSGNPAADRTGMGIAGPFYISSFETAYEASLRPVWRTVFAVIYLLLGLFHLIAAFRDARHRIRLIFGFFLICLAGFFLLYPENPTSWMPDAHAARRVNRILLSAATMFFIPFVSLETFGRIPRFFKAGVLSNALLIFAIGFSSSSQIALLEKIHSVCEVLFILPFPFAIVPYHFIREVKKSEGSSRWKRILAALQMTPAGTMILFFVPMYIAHLADAYLYYGLHREAVVTELFMPLIVGHISSVITAAERMRILRDAEEKKALEAERLLDLMRERSRISADLHDSLGASLTDALVALRTAGNHAGGASALLDRVQNSVQSALTGLRDVVASVYDMDRFEGSGFSTTLRMSILRRYSSLDRNVTVHIEEDAKDLLQKVDNKIRTALYMIAREAASNDVRYGSGVSTWKIYSNGEGIALRLDAETGYEPNGRKGHGRWTIRERAAEVGASLIDEIVDKRYSLELSIPVPKTFTD